MINKISQKSKFIILIVFTAAIVILATSLINYYYFYHNFAIENIVSQSLVFVFLIPLSFFLPRYMSNKQRLVLRYFENYGGYENAIRTYERSKKILYILMPSLIIVMSFNYYSSTNLKIWQYELQVLTIIEYIIISAILYIYIEIIPSVLVNKEFTFYLAKACLEIIQKESYDDKMYYLLLGLKVYNSYLRKTLSLQIKDLDRIIDKIICMPVAQRQSLTLAIFESFERDKLDLVRTLSKKYTEELKIEQFLIKVQLTQKIKEAIISITSFIIPLITVAITIISLFIGVKK